MDDDSLIREAQRGQREAFQQLLEHHYDTMYRFALRWSGHVADAEDITQQVCIKLAKSLKTYRFEAKFSTWLYRLVINSAHDWKRKQREVSSENIHEEGGEAGRAENLVYLRQVLRQVEALGREFRETVILVFGEGMSHSEAADILQVKESTISWRIHRIRQQLNLLDHTEAGGLA